MSIALATHDLVKNFGGLRATDHVSLTIHTGARHALIFGDEEVARGEVAVKPLREASAAQHTRVLSDAALWADELRTA